MTDLSQDEQTILLIAANGEPMMPIGRWRKAAEALVDRGYLNPRPHAGDPTGFFNLHITSTGRTAIAEAERAPVLAMHQLTADIERQQADLRRAAEAIAVQMVDLAERSNAITGDAPRDALEKWAKVIGKRALELVR